MPAFDLACADVPYMGIGNWQNRVFAVPPVMGIDYRVVNGYIYISGNPVTDPAKIGERASSSRSARATTSRTGTALREVEAEDGGADRRDHCDSRPDLARVRA